MKNNFTKRVSKLLLFLMLVLAGIGATAQTNPGGVGGAVVWLKADQGLNVSGNNVTSWVNQSGGTNFTGTGNPQLQASSVNFNPGIVFNGSNYLTSNASLLTNNAPYTKFIVFKYDGTTANNLVSSGPGGGHAFFSQNTNTDVVIHHAGNILTASNVVNNTRYFLTTGGFTAGLAGGTYINVNGAMKASMVSSAPYAATTMQLGAHSNGNNLTGRIAEVIVFPSTMGSSANTTRQVQSYLGLKYGIALTHNYLSSDGTVIYDVSSFGNNVTGIGRDDVSALNQKQSRNLNPGHQVMIALNAAAASNAANTASFAANKQFMIWGDDNGNLNNTSAISGWTNTTIRVNRIWKLQNTGNFNQQVTVYIPVAAVNALPGNKPYLIFNSSSTLAGGGTEIAAGAAVNVGGINCYPFQVTFAAGAATTYFSFASKAVNPGNVAGALVWLRPDAGVVANGTAVSGWFNQMGATNSFSSGGTPLLAEGNVNFQSAISFNGSSYLTSAGNVLPAGSPYTKFVVFKYDAAAANNIVSSAPGGNHAFFGNNTTTDLILWHQGNILNAAGSINTSRYFMGTGGFTRSLTGGTYINVDGGTKITGTSATTYVAGGIQLGAHNNTSQLIGKVAEVIVFPASLGANSVETRKIESYLGLKYGISVAHDYLASDGTTTTYTIAGFAGNIAGIGRDDNTALDQKQGRSINGNGQILMALGTAAATNAANANTFNADKQFLIWGDNNGSLTATTGLSGWTNTTTRLNRIWRLQNTGGFNQQVTVYFPVTNLNYLPGTNPFLICNNSNTLAGGGTEIPASSTVTIGGVLHKGFTVTFPSSGTMYFSFAAKAISPANVAGASVWLRPDAGLNTNAAGTAVTSWVNQMASATSFNATGAPAAMENNINFHTGVGVGVGKYLTSTGVVIPANSNYTKFVVFKYDNAGTNNILSSAAPGNNAFFGNNTVTDLVLFHAGSILTASNVTNTSRYYLGTGGFASGVANGTFISVDGVGKARIQSSAAHAAGNLQVGAYGDGNELLGRVAEVIVFPSALGETSTATKQIQSYLGVKYGITMGHDYLASDGTTTTYSIAGFSNNIAGIGRDDIGGLNQLQGQSINAAAGASQVVIAAGSIAASNADNANAIAGDKQYLVWGDNNGSITTTVAAAFPTVNNRFARVWKLQNTGSFNQEVTVYFPTSSLNMLTNATKYLIYNTDPALAGTGTEAAQSATATINGVAYTGFKVTFPTTGSLYFSFGSKAVHPGSVSGAALWVRGDAGLNTSGTSVTEWVNQVNTGNNFTPGAGNLQYSEAAVNFNPSVVFDGVGYLNSAANITTSTTGNYTKFVVFRTNGGAGGLNLLSGFSGGNGNAMYTQNMSLRMLHGPSFITSIPDASLNMGKQYLGTEVFSYGTANGTFLRLDGTTGGVVTSSAPHTVDRIHLGAYNKSNMLSAGSNIAEAVMYNSALTAADYQKVESYLALKYGLTLSNDYLATDATNVYALGAYGKNVAGIGRDDNTALNQRQSQSVNPGNQLVVALGAVAATNDANANVFSNDRQFLIWGNTDAPGFNYNTGISQKRLANTWKLQNTGSFNQAVTLYYPASGLAGLGPNPQLIYGSLSSLDDGSAVTLSAGANATINGEQYVSYNITFPVTATQYFSFAGQIVPEICGNGVDDDLDEYIDDLDATCAPVPGCTAPAPPLTNFSIAQEWVSSVANTLAASVSPSVADLDGDGVPEILAVRAGGAGITYFKGNGSDAAKNSVDYNIQLLQRVNQSTMQPAVADIDRDGIPEVIVVGGDGYVYVFNNVSGNASSYKFRSLEPVNTRFAAGSPRVADINEDGVPEIVVGLDVFQFNFGEGRLLKAVSGSTTAPCGNDGRATPNDWGADVVVIDIMPSNPGKEIVAGSQVYGINLSTGVTTVLANLTTITSGGIPANNDGPTAVGDLDYDGNLEVVYPNGAGLVIWDPVAGVLKMNRGYNNGGQTVRGQPTIANVYNEKVIDGKATDLPEVIFNCANNMHAFNLNTPAAAVWSLTTADNSGETGVTAFDLNGDGIQEIIYNDEANIRVIDGNKKVPGNVATFASGTATWMEHPIVVDVDNDGSAEFVCVSGIGSSLTGNLRVFGAPAGTTTWQNTRKVWNGRGYRPKSVNDDLSIPVKEQNITLQYPAGSGKFPLDVFNCQIDARVLAPGIIAASDLNIADLKVEQSATACEFNPAAAKLSFTISNNGSAAAPAGTPVRFYIGDPRLAGAVRLSATHQLANNLVVGASVTDNVILDLSAHTAPYNIYAVSNDDGTASIPFTLPLPNTNTKECGYNNNIASVMIDPAPADFGNLVGAWPAASASIPASNSAWLGIAAPNGECAANESDAADGLAMSSGSTAGTGSKANPWIVAGVGTVCKFNLTVNGNGTAKPVYWGVWYDVDANGSFTDPTDLFTSGVTSHGSPVTTNFNFTVPGAFGATNGALRVIASTVDPSFTKEMNGTGTFMNGEVEDFYITYAAPLPVTLKSFTVLPSGNCAARVVWSTSMEENTASFEIQRSADGVSFSTIATVKSTNNAQGSNYTFTDEAAIEGKSFYRLKMNDLNGIYQFSQMVVAQNTCSKTEILLTPNPVTAVGNLIGLRTGDRLQVISSDGKVLIEQVATASTQRLNLRMLSPGVHIVQVIRNGVPVAQLKFTKL